MPILYLVPTPLGNPGDITLRALRILRETSAVAADDPPAARALLDAYDLPTPIIAYADLPAALQRGDVALIGASGTPGIGGAAHEIVRSAIADGIRVEPLPGASAEIMALVLSGLPTDAFVYVGTRDLTAYAQERVTLILRAADPIPALESLLATFGDRRVCATAALTQPGEIVYRGMISDALTFFLAQSSRHELLLVVEGAPPPMPEVWDEARVRSAIRQHLMSGEPVKTAAKAVAEAANWDRRTVYALGVDEKRNQP